MKDLGRTEAEMYPSMVDAGNTKKKKHYPKIELPIDLLPDNADLDTEITVKIKGKITRIEKSEYSKDFTVKAIEAEVE